MSDWHCSDCEDAAMRRLATLAHNLATAAGLCAAHRLGYAHGYASCPCGGYLNDEDYDEIDSRHWSPGCAKPAAGFEQGGR